MRILMTLLLTLFLVSSFTTKKMVTVLLVMDSQEEDKVLITSIRTSLMSAEKVSGILDIQMVADENAKDVFVFNIESSNQKELIMEILDEEGYEMVGNNVMNLTQGENYKALNVTSLSDGTYLFKLKDNAGNEMTKSFNVVND